MAKQTAFSPRLQEIQNKYKNNKEDILNDIYSVDEEGNEYWHGVKIESEKMTDEEVKELEDLLKNF